MQIPEGYRLQLQGLTEDQRRLICEEYSSLPATGSVPTCIYNTGRGDGMYQWGEEASYNRHVLRLIPIYIAEELQQPAPEPEQTEIDLGGTRWDGRNPEIFANYTSEELQVIRTEPAVSYRIFDDVEPFEDF